ncbi:MAG TPA: glycoside hydrolase family 5 protein [Armatimonadota bacterium]
MHRSVILLPPTRRALVLTTLAALCLAFPADLCAAAPLPYTGVNLAGGEFGSVGPGQPPVYNKGYVYPTAEEFDYFAGKGMNLFRIPFHWEVLQPEPKKPLSPVELKRLRDVVKLATSRKLTVILDPHNYARYYGKVVGGPEVGQDVFADFWGRMAREFKGDSRVWFGLVNEPNGMPTGRWLRAANAAIAAIRDAGATNLILVPGNAYSGAHSWTANWYGEPNSQWMTQVKDPRGNYLIEVHQYLDSDSSGTHVQEVVSPTIGSERLKGFTEWARRNHVRALLGEFAVPATEQGRQALTDMLSAMERDRDVWMGFTWWAAGAWWGDYPFSLEPSKGQDRPQMGYLAPFLQKRRPVLERRTSPRQRPASAGPSPDR